MLSKKPGKVIRIKSENDQIQDLIVEVEGKEYRAYNYIGLTGLAKIGDNLILNTTAVELSLGTGGSHFVILNEDNKTSKYHDGGHIMKMRYTPIQIKVDAVEEQGSPYHDIINKFETLDGMPVAIGALHSILQPFSATYKKINPDKKLVYIMTDSAALPISFSKNVENLKKIGLIDNTITYGSAFGGDYECINIYTALITAKEICKADCVLVAMGPGIAGTGTKYGFSGIDQATIIDAVDILGGQSFFIPRISFADARQRHQGISHHSLTILGQIANRKTKIVFNSLYEKEKLDIIKNQIKINFIDKKHEIYFEEYADTKNDLDKYSLKVSTMGRKFEEDQEFFEAASVVAYFISK